MSIQDGIQSVLGDEAVTNTITDIKDIIGEVKSIWDTIFTKQNVETPTTSTNTSQDQLSESSTSSDSVFGSIPSWVLVVGAVLLLIVLMKVIK